MGKGSLPVGQLVCKPTNQKTRYHPQLLLDQLGRTREHIMGKNIRILLVDDEVIVREAIAALLEMESGMTVVGEAGSAEGALRKVRSLRPDVVLLDIRLPDQSGVEVISTMLHHQPNLSIVLLTAFADDQEVATAFRAGAVGYVLKTQAVNDLVRAIENAHHGLSSVPPRIAKIMLQTLNPPCRPQPKTRLLSEAERRVLVYVARGLQNKEIARHLGVSRPTVHAHISHILAKLDLENRTQAALFAIKEGIAVTDIPAMRVFKC
jgi:NarL family two-component system response regulator LiaR